MVSPAKLHRQSPVAEDLVKIEKKDEKIIGEKLAQNRSGVAF
jgi:hypothetical protein